MNSKLFILGISCFIISQIMIWFQSHLQFIFKWSQDNPLIMSVPGVIVSYFSILATTYLAEAFGGLVWPSRLIGFGVGITLFSILTWFILKEPLTMKSIVSVGLALIIILIQILWK